MLNLIDYIIIGIFGVSALLSLMRGFVREAISLTSWILALVLAFKFSGTFAGYFSNYFQTPFVRTAAAFTCIVLAVLLVGMLLSILIRSIVSQVGLGGLDRLLGLAFGAARGMLIVAVIYSLAGLTPLTSTDAWQHSLLLPSFQGLAKFLSGLLPAQFTSMHVGDMLPSMPSLPSVSNIPNISSSLPTINGGSNSITGSFIDGLKSQLDNIMNMIKGGGSNIGGIGGGAQGLSPLSIISK